MGREEAPEGRDPSVVAHLPESPLQYAEIIDEIGDDLGRWRAMVKEDFWFACKTMFSVSGYRINEPHHPQYGGYYVEDPFVFTKCRELQMDSICRVSGVFYNWPRFTLKTELITKNLTLWELLRNPQLTFCILTYKVDETGQAMFQHLRSELEQNEKIKLLFPEIYPLDRSVTTSLTVNRELGPKEPSVSIHPLFHMPTSQHYDVILTDDGVVQDTVTNMEMIRKTKSMIRLRTALEKDFSITRDIGTIWDAYDPNMQLISEGFFTFRDHEQPYKDREKKEDPILRSSNFWEDWERKLGPYHSSSQLYGEPIAKGDQAFDPSWLNTRFENDPLEEAKGKSVYIFVDFAGDNTEGDYFVFVVMALGEDRCYYVLDIYRERGSLMASVDDLFRYVRTWRPREVWIEEFGASAHKALLKREMESRMYRFRVRGLPKTNRSKEFRIQMMQPPMKRGEVYFPRDGFGHGSSADSRDVLLQFQEDEFRLWTPVKGSTLHDDMLDCMAWPFQPEVHLRWPRRVDVTSDDDLHSTFGSGRSKARSLAKAVSWEAW